MVVMVERDTEVPSPYVQYNHTMISSRCVVFQQSIVGLYLRIQGLITSKIINSEIQVLF